MKIKEQGRATQEVSFPAPSSSSRTVIVRTALESSAHGLSASNQDEAVTITAAYRGVLSTWKLGTVPVRYMLYHSSDTVPVPIRTGTGGLCVDYFAGVANLLWIRIRALSYSYIINFFQIWMQFVD